MFLAQRLRYKALVYSIQCQLKDMGLDSRVFPGGSSEAKLKSSASTPSLRSREAEVVTMGRNTPVTEGGNVRVVVRVRGFLPRGERDDFRFSDVLTAARNQPRSAMPH